MNKDEMTYEELKQKDREETNQEFEDLKQTGKQALLTGVSAFALSWAVHEVGKLIKMGFELFNKK